MDPTSWIVPDWPAPHGVRAASTTRAGGASRAPFDALNLGVRTGDDALSVTENRERLIRALELPEMPRWLAQIHGSRVVRAEFIDRDQTRADASVTARPGLVCAVLTADCLPVLFCDAGGTQIGAAHAGWRGLVAGVLEQTVNAMDAPAADLIAWLGPAIGPTAFEIGEDVYEAFRIADPGCEGCFAAGPPGRWHADLYALARRRLAAAGVGSVHGGGRCTHSEPRHFFSHRRDGRTGRMATLIWRPWRRRPSRT